MRMNFSTRGGNVGSRKNASRQEWLAGIRRKARSGRGELVKFTERPGRMTTAELVAWFKSERIEFNAVEGGFRVMHESKVKAA